MVTLHDSRALLHHCTASGFDPQSAARVARAVLRHGKSYEEALGASTQPVPRAWREGLDRDGLVELLRQESQLDGATKLVWRTAAGQRLESVLLRVASGRTSLCLSIQTRCPVACSFCASGTRGRVESLNLDDLLEQVVRARRLLREEGRTLRNLVFMGMGEPLLEPELLHEALDRLSDPGGFGFPENRLMVSTVGIPREMERLAKAFPQVRQALSLHSARQEVRESLIPMARRHSLEELRESIRRVAELSGGQVMVEYLLLAGVTDRSEDEEALAQWLAGLPVRLNLIPFNRPSAHGPNSSVDSSLEPTSLERARELAAAFRQRGTPTNLRRSLGQDIAAACGQLATQTESPSPL